MATLEEAEAERWCIDNGLMEDPYEWSEWKRHYVSLFKPVRSTVSGKLMFRDVYMRRKKIRMIDRNTWRDKWTYQYASKKETLLATLKNK